MNSRKVKDISDEDKLLFRDNKIALIKLFCLIIFIGPIVLISEDNITRFFLFIYICYFIKKHAKDYGKKYGKMSIRLGVGRFIRLKIFFVVFSLGTTFNIAEDIASEVLIYTTKRYVEPRTAQQIKFISIFYKTVAFAPDLANRGVLIISDQIETKEDEFLDLLKNKLIDHLFYEAFKRDVCFKLLKMKDEGLFIDREKRGVYEYFIIGTIERVWNSIIDSISFVMRNFIWALAYYILAFVLSKFIVKWQTTHHSNS